MGLLVQNCTIPGKHLSKKKKEICKQYKSQQNTFILLIIVATLSLHRGIVSCANALFSIQNTTKICPTLISG